MTSGGPTASRGGDREIDETPEAAETDESMGLESWTFTEGVVIDDQTAAEVLKDPTSYWKLTSELPEDSDVRVEAESTLATLALARILASPNGNAELNFSTYRALVDVTKDPACPPALALYYLGDANREGASGLLYALAATSREVGVEAARQVLLGTLGGSEEAERCAVDVVVALTPQSEVGRTLKEAMVAVNDGRRAPFSEGVRFMIEDFIESAEDEENFGALQASIVERGGFGESRSAASYMDALSEEFGLIEDGFPGGFLEKMDVLRMAESTSDELTAVLAVAFLEQTKDMEDAEDMRQACIDVSDRVARGHHDLWEQLGGK